MQDKQEEKEHKRIPSITEFASAGVTVACCAVLAFAGAVAIGTLLGMVNVHYETKALKGRSR